MAESKYSKMPGIEVYETSDLPEADQQIQGSSDDSVENLGISPPKAYDRFKGKAFGPGDRFSGQEEYEMLGDGSGEKETVQQKYYRLQHEIRDLSEAVEQAKAKVKVEMSTQGMTPVVLAKQVENLKQLVAELNLDKHLGAVTEVNLTDPHGTVHKRLMSELDKFKASEVKSPATKSKAAAAAAAPTDPDHVAYQLFYHPEQTKFHNSARLADLEQRLEKLETLLGNTPEKITPLTSELASKSLLGAVSMLSARAKLMDPSQLDQMENRLTTVCQKLVQLSEKKEVLEHQEKLNKVAELYDMVEKWSGYSLPLVVDRLSTLRDLHSKALEFRQALSQLESAQKQIATELKTGSDLLQQVHSTVANNLTAIQANYESLASRMKAVGEDASVTKS